MARKIAIELEVNGVKESINTINDLEGAIESLTEELKNTDIGSEKFNKLTNELNTAKSELKSFEATFEGLDPQQKTQAYLAFGEGVVSGILLAQEALRTFGIENENVNSAVEASTKAINIALQARVVAESVLEARILATTLAQKALNTSMVAGNRVLKIIFATMAANPIGAILAVIGLLVAAFIALSDSTDEATTAQEKYNDIQAEAQKQTAKTIAQLNFYADVVNDTKRNEEERIIALEKLAEAGIKTDDINLDNVESLDLLNERLETARENILLKAQSEAVASLLAESFKEVIDAQNSELEENIGFFEKAGNAILSFGNGYLANARNVRTAAENQAEAINEAQEKVNQYQQIFIDIQEKLLKNQAEIREDVGKKTLKEFDRFKNVLEGARKELDKLNRSVLEFGELPEPPIIQELQRLIELQNRYIELTDESEKSLKDVFTEYFVDVKAATQQTDEFGIAWDKTREFLSEAFATGDVDDFQKRITEVQEEYLGESSKFTEEQKRAVASLLSQYSTAFDTLTRLGLKVPEEFRSVVVPLLDGIASKLRLEGSINFREISDEEEILRTSETITDLISNLETLNETTEGTEDTSLFNFDLEEDRIERIGLDIKTLQEGTEEFYERRDELISLFSEKYLETARIRKLADEDETAAREEALKLATETADNVIGTIQDIATAEDAIRGVNNEVEDLTRNLAKGQDNIKVITGVIIENFDLISEEYDLTKLFDPTAGQEQNFQQVITLLEELGLEGVDIIFDTEQEKTDIVEFFLKKRKELLEENAKDEKEIQEKSLQDTIENYEEIVNGLNQLTLSLGEKSQLQIERIEARREESLANVVGDTEEAEKLRTEITEEANREIVEVERKARLRELQFTKIQAVADLAQALVNAQKLPPPFNVIQSGIVGTAGSIQLAVIESQIQDLQGAQGFATGGFVSGEGTGTSDSIPAFLSNGEFVVNAKATKQYLPLLEKINNEEQQFNKFANGGFVLDGLNIPSSNIQNIFDDSRIIEELRKTRQEPLRAYVFEKDITDAQQIEKRLQELSKL